MADAFDNIIVLRSVYGKVEQKIFMNPVRDPKTGMYPSCVKHVDSKGDMILTDKEKNSGEIFVPETKVFIIQDGTTFNLNDPYQAADWYAIQHCPLIAMSRDQRDSRGNLVIDGDSRRYGSAELYVERPGFETRKKVSKRKLIHKAETFIYQDKMGTEGHRRMAKILGRPMKNAPAADVEDFLLETASKDPQTIIELYTSDKTNYRLLLIDAKDKHIIYTKNKFYVYGDDAIVLGATDDAVVTWMESPSNHSVLDRIKREVYPELYAEEPNKKQK